MALPYWQISNCTTTSNYVFDTRSCNFVTSTFNVNLSNATSCTNFMYKWNSMYGANNFAPFQRLERNRDKPGYHYNTATIGWFNSSYYSACWGMGTKHNMKPTMQYIGTDGTFNSGSKGDALQIPCKTITDRCGCSVTHFYPPRWRGETSYSHFPTNAQRSWTYNGDGLAIHDGRLFHRCAPNMQHLPGLTGRGWQGTDDECCFAQASSKNMQECMNCGHHYKIGNQSGLMYYPSCSTTGQSVWSVGWAHCVCCCSTCGSLRVEFRAASTTPEDVFSDPTNDLCTTRMCYCFTMGTVASCQGGILSMAFGGEADTQEFWWYANQSGGRCDHNCNFMKNCCCRVGMLVKMKAPDFGGAGPCFTQECAFFIPPSLFNGCNACRNFTASAYALCSAGADRIFAKGETFFHLDNSFSRGRGSGACCGIKWFSNNWIFDYSSGCCGTKTIAAQHCGCYTPVDIEYTSRGTWLISYVRCPGRLGVGCCNGPNCNYPTNVINVEEWNAGLTSRLGTVSFCVSSLGCCVSIGFPCSAWMGGYLGHKITYDHTDDAFLLGVNFGAGLTNYPNTSSHAMPGAVFARMPANLQTYASKICCVGRTYYGPYCCIYYCLCAGNGTLAPSEADSYGQGYGNLSIYLANCVSTIPCIEITCGSLTCTNCCFCAAMCTAGHATEFKCRATLCACAAEDCCCRCECRFHNSRCNAVMGQHQAGTHFTRIHDFV